MRFVHREGCEVFFVSNSRKNTMAAVLLVIVVLLAAG